MIHLSTLGAMRASDRDGGPLSLAGQQPKRIALVGYLAIARPPGLHRRDTVIGLLWPELDQDHARAALRQALHAIRNTLGRDVITSAGTESIGLDRRAVRCDLWELEDAAAAGDHARALALYQGELLHGLFVSGVPEFEQWLDGERVRVRNLVRDCAWSAAAAALTDGRPHELAQHVRTAVALSEFDEGAIRHALELLVRGGERAAALAIYERFATQLKRELDAEPSSETRSLVAGIRLDSATTAVAHPAASPGPSGPQAWSASSGPSGPLAPAGGRRKGGRLVAAAAVAAVFVALAAAARLDPEARRPPDPRAVRIGVFTNETDNTGLDPIARATQLAARDALVRLENVRVTDAGAGTLVRGSIRMAHDSIELRAEILDIASGTIRRSVFARGPHADAAAALDVVIARLTDRLAAAVATALYPGWGTALSQPLSYDGYRLFVHGMRSIRLERHDDALAAFQRAFAADSTFTAAGLLAAMELYQLKRFAAADSMAALIGKRRERLPTLDAHLLDWLTRSLRGDRVGARASMQAITAIAPTADLAWLRLAIDNVETARPREALAALDRIDQDADFGEGWLGYWATRLEALHTMGDHRRELTVAREALRRYPDLRVLVVYELRALAALGRVDDAVAVVQQLASLPASDALDAPTVMRQVALEFAAHGNTDVSNSVLRQARAWYDARPAAERASRTWHLGYARTLYLADEREGARAMYDAVLQQQPGCVDCVGMLGVLAARDGDLSTATAYDRQLGAVTGKFVFGRNLLWQSRIALTLGDRARAASLLHAAFSAGTEFDAMTHTDPDLVRLRPDSVYRRFVRVGP